MYTGTDTSPSRDRRNFAGPYVTSVGGTKRNSPDGSKISGGGFSNYFTIPDYQQGPVVQEGPVATFLRNWADAGNLYVGLYRCVCSRGLTQPILTV
jgi:hypothetical protein